MALLTPQVIPVTGIKPTFAAAAGGGDTISPDTGLILAVLNGGGAPITVTLVRPGSEYGQANPDVAFSVTNNATAALLAVPREFVDPTTGTIGVTYSGVTSVTVALLKH